MTTTPQTCAECRVEWVETSLPTAHVERILLCPRHASVGRLVEALDFYANPENYHAIAFEFDRPCGEFEDDFSEDHGHEFYRRPMPGKRARAALGEAGEP